jgi:hypothetical protein
MVQRRKAHAPRSVALCDGTLCPAARRPTLHRCPGLPRAEHRLSRNRTLRAPVRDCTGKTVAIRPRGRTIATGHIYVDDIGQIPSC